MRALHRSRGPVLTALLLSLLAACGGEEGRRSIRLGGETFAVEIADQDAKRERGLMFREQLGAREGMLFVWEDEALRSFWMKNTRIPLDILHFDGERRLVDMHLAVPPCLRERCPSYVGIRPARYVLEVPAGTAKALGLRIGDRFEWLEP